MLSGAFTTNTLTQTVAAAIDDGSSVVTSHPGDAAASVTLTAIDSSELMADAGGVAIAVAIGKGGGSAAVSVGAATSANTLKDTVNATIDSSTVTAGGGVSLTAKSQKNPNYTAAFRVDALAFGVAASVSGQAGTGTTIALDGAGSSATNTIDNTVLADITNTQKPMTATKVTAQGGGVSLTASDANRRRADSGAMPSRARDRRRKWRRGRGGAGRL